MLFSSRILMAAGLSALLLSGCNGENGDVSADGGSSSDAGDSSQPEKPVVVAPSADSAPDFMVRPYLQAPSPDGMTVLFETADGSPEVWARPFGSSDAFNKVPADAVADGEQVYQARLDGLSSNTLYEYYVLTRDGEGAVQVTQPFAFKTWPVAADGVDKAEFLALSDTQLDRSEYVDVLDNVVEKGFMTLECDGSHPETCAENIAGITISGDVVQVGGNRQDWREQMFGRMAAITPYVPLITVPGNHDYYSDAEIKLYRTYMAPPANGSVGYDEHWYYLDYLGLRLVGLDSYPISGAHGAFNRDTLAIQRQWLKETLRDARLSDMPFVFGLFHHGCLSELWNVGESIGSCELVAELEQYSADTGAITGHLFGHTHAYSRGQSMNVPHLWLDAASASGYVEPLDDAGHQSDQIRDYDTFAVSRSEFGYNVLTFRFEPDPSLTLQRRKGGYDGDTAFDVVDEVTFHAESNNALPAITAGEGELQPADVSLGISVAQPEAVEAVQWQVSETEDFSDTVFDIWGNDTRRHNWFYDSADQVGGNDLTGFEAIDTQQFVDILSLDLSTLADQKTLRAGGDDYYRWNKRYSSQNTHVSGYDAYAGQTRPNLSLKPGATYFWRARTRDNTMNWSAWTETASFSIAGTQTANLLVNGDAETGDTSSWDLEAGLMSAIGAGDNGGFGAAVGDYYFAGRGFGQGAPADCCVDSLSQAVDLSAYATQIDSGGAYLEFEARMTTWEGKDTPMVYVEAYDGAGDTLDWSGSTPQTVSTAKSWQPVQISAVLPSGTRRVKVVIGGERQAGSDNDVYFDEMTLHLLY